MRIVVLGGAGKMGCIAVQTLAGDDRVKEVLPSFKPVWNLKKGAQELYEVFKNEKLSPEEFEGPRFKRILHIRKLLDTGALDSSLRWKQYQKVAVN